MAIDIESRARLSGGTSTGPVYALVARVLHEIRGPGGTLLELGCGRGCLWTAVRSLFQQYVGCDIVRYDGFPADCEFLQVDLETGRVPLSSGTADVVAAVETIEHLENPRALARELVRLTRPGGWVVITTPNNLSFLSKLTFVFKNQFNSFQDGSYPAHITPLIEADLRRIAAECGLFDVRTVFSLSGRLPGTPWHYPPCIARLLPRALSDTILLAGRKSI